MEKRNTSLKSLIPYIDETLMNDQKHDIIKLIKTLNENGFEAYVAGGAVRDFISGGTISDYDIVTRARPEKILEIFRKKKAYIAGKAFRVCYIGSVEIATYRDKNGYFSDSLREDLKRRDLTINSMAMNLETGKIIDYYGGKKDLKKRIIRFTENPEKRIQEDPLRIIRACRFLAKYQGTFSEATFSAIQKNNTLIKTIAPERIKTELIKAMMVKTPGIFFNALYDSGILRYFLPSLHHLVGLDGGPHHDETVFEHVMLAGNAIQPGKPLLRLTAFLHDTGKKEAFKIMEGKPVFHGHEKKTDALENDLKRLKFSNRERDFILNLVHVHMRPLDRDTSPKSVRKLLADLSVKNLSWYDFLHLRIADRKGNLKKKPYSFSELKIKIRKIKDEVEKTENPAFSIRDLEITGSDLIREFNFAESPVIGNILMYLFNMILEDPELNKRERLLDLTAEYIENNTPPNI